MRTINSFTLSFSLAALALLLSRPVISQGQTIETPTPVISGVIDGHEYADLGLPSGTLWATCNVGADVPGEIGIVASWGETEQKEESYYWEDYKYFEKFVRNEYGFYDVICTDIGDDICGTEYDAATEHWGEKWKMPNYDEIKELRRNC